MSETETGKKRPAPVKVLSSQLRTAENCGDSYWVRPGRGRSLRASLVWMQGTVMEVQLDGDSVLLMDETGTFTVQGVRGIPKGKPCLSPGTHTSDESANSCRLLLSPRQGDIIGTKITPNEPLLAAVAGQVLSKVWKCTFMSSRTTTGHKKDTKV